mgnify:FL=1
MIVRLVLLSLFLALPLTAHAGVFMGMERELVDPAKGEKPVLIVTFDEALHRAMITVTTEDGFKKQFAVQPVVPGRDLRYEWSPPKAGEVMYEVSVEMVGKDNSHETQDDLFFVTSASPITASIDPMSVDLESRTFSITTNHAPASVRMQVLSDTMETLGEATVATPDAKNGVPTKVTWPQDKDGNVLRVLVTAEDAYGYFAEVEIIPWSLTIPHEDVIFPTGSHEILADEAPKVERAWDEIVKAYKKYGELVQITLYVAGYTDTVGDAGSNQALSERRAKSLATFFKGKKPPFAIHYQGFGEAVLAKRTADGVDEAANRRALYILTAGPAPRSSETPRAAWKKL